MIKDIKQKLIDDNAIVTKADNRNTMAILDEVEYNEKFNNFIRDSNTLAFTKDPTSQYKINLTLNKCKHLLTMNEQRKLKSYELICT